MSFLQVLGKQTIDLVDLSNSINKIVFSGFNNILHDLSDGLDLKKSLNSDDKQDLIDLAHKINIIKDLDESSKEYLDELRELIFLKKKIDNNRSFLYEVKNTSLELLDISTGINRLLLDSIGDLFDTVSNSANLQTIIKNQNISLSDMADQIEIIKKIDNAAYDVFKQTEQIF
jgi:hypothetical protein